MSPRHKPTEEEARQAVEVLLRAVETGEDIFDAFERSAPFGAAITRFLRRIRGIGR